LKCPNPRYSDWNPDAEPLRVKMKCFLGISTGARRRFPDRKPNGEHFLDTVLSKGYTKKGKMQNVVFVEF
jgi:hypothetical protein